MALTITLTEKEKNRIFNEEFLPHAEALLNFGYHLTKNQVEAEDLMQETYLKSFKAIDKYLVGTNAKAWLFRILKNEFINRYRQNQRRPNSVDIDEVYNIQNQEDSSSPHSAYVDLSEEMYKNMMGDEITIALNSLAEDFRVVILLCDIEGFTYEEISKIIDIPIGTVRSRLFRARNMLKEKLRGYAQEMGYEEKRGKKNNDGDTDEEE